MSLTFSLGCEFDPTSHVFSVFLLFVITAWAMLPSWAPCPLAWAVTSRYNFLRIVCQPFSGHAARVAYSIGTAMLVGKQMPLRGPTTQPGAWY